MPFPCSESLVFAAHCGGPPSLIVREVCADGHVAFRGLTRTQRSIDWPSAESALAWLASQPGTRYLRATGYGPYDVRRLPPARVTDGIALTAYLVPVDPVIVPTFIVRITQTSYGQVACVLEHTRTLAGQGTTGYQVLEHARVDPSNAATALCQILLLARAHAGRAIEGDMALIDSAWALARRTLLMPGALEIALTATAPRPAA